MRDDLHKKAPVPPRVQRLFQLALREADRMNPDRLVTAAQAALDQAMRQGCSNDTIYLVSGQADQTELFFPAEGKRPNSPMEADVLNGLTCHPDRPPAEALRDALSGYADSWSREIRATLVADGTVPNTGEVMSVIVDALDTAASNVARSVCENEALARSLPPADLGENLLPSAWVRK
ncbi:MAG: hypothetical protein ACO1OD_13580 [Croceibacterium sp.]